MEIEFEGQYTKDQYFKAVRILGLPSKLSMALRIFFFLLSLGLVIGYSITITREGTPTGYQSSRVIRYLITTSLFAYFLFRPYINVHLNATRLWNDPLVQRKITGRVTSQGITYGTLTQEWGTFARKVVMDNMIVLFTADRVMSLLPRHFFQDEMDWNRFRQIVSSRVVEAK